MIFSLKRTLAKQYALYRSWKPKVKYVVIESDDWGSERTRDKQALAGLLRIAPNIANDRFTCIDSIESVDDLTQLYSVLQSVKDIKGNPAIITANFCMANPDFESIKESDFTVFAYERFDKTIKARTDGDKVLELIKLGNSLKIFRPQLHGREHVHALAWMEELALGNPMLLQAFSYNSWSIPYTPIKHQRRKNLLASLDIYNIAHEERFQQRWIEESASMFADFFGFYSTTFIPPAYTWHTRILPFCKQAGIKAIQGMHLQYEPNIGEQLKKYNTRLQILGSVDSTGLVRIVRNSPFEPASDPGKDWVGSCLKNVEIAFKHNMPAIIGSHRINFIGSLNEKNREQNLTRLSQLLKAIVSKWPEVEFVSSDELIEKI